MVESETPRPPLQCPDRSGAMCKDVEWIIRYYDGRLRTMDRALDIASQLMKERMDGFPEQYVKKGETSEELSRMRADLNILLGFMNRSEGLASSKSVDTVRWIAIGGLIVSIAGLLLRFMNH